VLVIDGIEKLGGAGTVLGWAISGLVVIIIGAAQYRRSSSTASHQEIVPDLLRARTKYCLILRPFGHDAEIVLPKATPKGRAGGGPFTRNITLEQVIATAAQKVLGIKTYGFVDQHAMFAPPGPILMRASGDWQLVAGQLIRHAHVIVLIIPPSRDFGEGFLWELERIRRCEAATRVVIVLPPSDQDAETHAAALRRACALLPVLEGDLDDFKAYEYELTIPVTTLLIRQTQHGPKSWVTSDESPGRTMIGSRRKTVVADKTYLEMLEPALLEIDHEHPTDLH